jgi:ribosome biogenesis GTPase
VKLEDLGYNDTLEKFRIEHDLNNLEIGRITSEHRERYTVQTIKGEFQAEITGNIRFTAKSREDFPAVGDWVALTTHDFDFAIIHHILPRFSMIKRQAVGQFGEVQIIATNIDYAFIIQAVDNNFNINRLERYLTICNSSNINSIIVLTKTDLIDEHRINEILDRIKTRIKNTPIIPISNATKNGYESINSCIEQGKTYCMLGSSGVGKSTLLNNLSGKSLMRTDQISQSTHKGKHVTSHRQLIILENGGILIDTPGMREIGIADTERGLETTFDMIVRLSNDCKFKDCTHTIEKGCAILEAIKNGELEKDSYENYLKMESEKKHFESTVEEKRKKDKAFGKMVKNYKKNINRKK